jgi:hypothetical protein
MRERDKRRNARTGPQGTNNVKGSAVQFSEDHAWFTSRDITSRVWTWYSSRGVDVFISSNDGWPLGESFICQQNYQKPSYRGKIFNHQKYQKGLEGRTDIQVWSRSRYHKQRYFQSVTGLNLHLKTDTTFRRMLGWLNSSHKLAQVRTLNLIIQQLSCRRPFLRCPCQSTPHEV